jgi:hypothetical protein
MTVAHSITSSARASSIGRTVRLSAFAILRLPDLNVLKTAERAAPVTQAECPSASPLRCRVPKLGPRVSAGYLQPRALLQRDAGMASARSRSLKWRLAMSSWERGSKS